MRAPFLGLIGLSKSRMTTDFFFYRRHQFIIWVLKNTIQTSSSPPPLFNMDQADIHPVPSRLLDPSQCPTPHVNSMEQYRSMWKESVEEPNLFFGNVQKKIKKRCRTTFLTCPL